MSTPQFTAATVHSLNKRISADVHFEIDGPQVTATTIRRIDLDLSNGDGAALAGPITLSFSDLEAFATFTTHVTEAFSELVNLTCSDTNAEEDTDGDDEVGDDEVGDDEVGDDTETNSPTALAADVVDAASAALSSTALPVDELLPEVCRFVVLAEQANTHSVARKFGIDMNRAIALLNALRDRGVLGGFKPSWDEYKVLVEPKRLDDALHWLATAPPGDRHESPQD